MKIMEALFSSTENLKGKTRKEIRVWLYPMLALEYLLAYFLPLVLTISTYYSEVEDGFKLSAVAYIISGVLLLLMYGRMRKGLSSWQTNRRVKWTLLALIKFIPIAAIGFVLMVMEANTEVFMDVVNKVVISYSASMLLNMFTSPLRTELEIRDKIKLNTENGRILD